MGHQSRLSISVENFVNLMGQGYSVTNLKHLDVWASDDFFSVGIFQTEKSLVKHRQQCTVVAGSQNVSSNMDMVGSCEIMLVAKLKRKLVLVTRASAKWICYNSRTDKPHARKALPTPPGTINLMVGPSSGDPKFLNPADLMEPGSSLGIGQVTLDYTDLANKGPSAGEQGFLDIVDLTESSLDVYEYTLMAHIDLTKSAVEEGVSSSPIDLTAQGKPVQQRSHWFLGFIDLTGGDE